MRKTDLVDSMMKFARLLTFPWLIADWLRARRRNAIASKPFPDEWKIILQRLYPVYNLLPAKLRHKLQKHINVFLHEKRFEGCGGLVITDEMRLVIAAQACLLLINRPRGYYSRLSTILVYPTSFMVDRAQSMGMANLVSALPASGQAWIHDYVILAWDDVQHGAINVSDGHNVVLHEFAHQLDAEDGSFDGVPVLEQRSQYVSWARILNSEYTKHCSKVLRGHRALFDDYGAESPAEFFSVITETFFEKSKAFKAKYPDLYAELRKFYRLDPSSWSELGP